MGGKKSSFNIRFWTRVIMTLGANIVTILLVIRGDDSLHYVLRDQEKHSHIYHIQGGTFPIPMICKWFDLLPSLPGKEYFRYIKKKREGSYPYIIGIPLLSNCRVSDFPHLLAPLFLFPGWFPFLFLSRLWSRMLLWSYGHVGVWRTLRDGLCLHQYHIRKHSS